jgi:hypothetical protein
LLGRKLAPAHFPRHWPALPAGRDGAVRQLRQVGDPFITPYLAGVYQRLGLEYSGLLCFTRTTLLWRRIAAARVATAAAAAAATAQAAAAAAKAGEVPSEGRHETDGLDAAAAAGAGPAASPQSPQPPPPVGRSAARIVPMDWHVQQLHRELVLEVR